MTLAGPLAGAYVQDLDTGAALYARKDTAPRPPASVEKLYTTSTALVRFGPAASLRTQVLTAGVVDELGVLRGNLYLRGGGDPTLSQAKVTALAAAVAAQSGIARVDGSVLGDESLFDARRGGARTAFAFDRDIGGVLSGLAVGRGFSRVGAPALDAARRFVKALRAAGVRVDGRTGVGPTPAEAREVAGVDSPPMSELARLTNAPSDNFDAEMLLKALGAAFGGAGTTPAGAAVVRQQLSVFGITPQVVDGSGGRTGTVRRRMRGTPAQDRCRTKTGTLRAVSALAGYCVTTAGRTVAFAMLMSTRNITRAHVVQDRMTAAIATYGS
jgi:D-alanyl-D-alanine carboxypeptidase/D-alanyl-D-alanine-endopeptidase (penicillin-binding protein 4)